MPIIIHDPRSSLSLSTSPWCVSRSDVSDSRFTGAMPDAQVLYGFSITGNFFQSYAPTIHSDVCYHVFLSRNCLPAVPGWPDCYQAQRNADLCNVTCSTPCPGTDVCYVMDSNTPACPCGPTQYASALNPGACQELNSEWGLWLHGSMGFARVLRGLWMGMIRTHCGFMFIWLPFSCSLVIIHPIALSCPGHC